MRQKYVKKNEARRKIVRNPRTDTLQLFFARFKEKNNVFKEGKYKK